MSIYYDHITWDGLNFLTANQASFETNTNGWEDVSNAVLARVTTQFDTGVASLRVTAFGNFSTFVGTPDGVDGFHAPQGGVISARARVRANTTGRVVNLIFVFFDGAGNTISSSMGPSVADVSGSWTTIEHEGVAVPAGTQHIQLQVLWNATPTGEIHFLDSVMVVPSATVGAFSAGVIETMDYFQLQRFDDIVDDWVDIAFLNIDFSSFDDYESARGIESCYRLRIVDIYGAPSDWTATECETLPVEDCKYNLTSNVRPDLNVEYDDIRPRKYGFPEAPEVLNLHNRYGVAVFRHTEDRGLSFTMNLILHSEGTPSFPTPTPGVVTFNPIVSLARADLPYVCVKDSDGNRLYCALFPPTNDEATRQEPGGLYTIPIAVREVAEIPTPVSFLAPE